MENASIKKEIADQLDALPPELQQRVLELVRTLASSVPKGVRGKDLLRFAGAIPKDDLQAMTKAIEAGCERTNDEW